LVLAHQAPDVRYRIKDLPESPAVSSSNDLLPVGVG
jgi:hypothetical protein